MIHARLIAFPDYVGVDTLHVVYPGFEALYRSHLDKKFDSVKGQDFKFLKDRLLLVRHLLMKNPNMDEEKRAELVQALISEDNFHEAQKMLPNSDKKKESGILIAVASRVYKVFSGGQSNEELEEEALKKDMKKITASVTDSQFLLGLKSLETEGLRHAIQQAETLAHTYLSSSIDAVVKKMTHAVLKMQEDSCKGEIQKDVQTKETRALSDALIAFIQDLNARSAGRKTS